MSRDDDPLTRVYHSKVIAPNVAVAALPDRRLELWATDNQGGLFTTWKVDTDPNANWSGWSDFLAEVGPLPGGAAQVAVAALGVPERRGHIVV